MEEWKYIQGSKYEISSDGRVRNSVTRRILAQDKLGAGYMMLKLRLPFDGKKLRYVHQLVAAAFLGPKPKGMQVDHIDRNKTNNCISNLRYVWQPQNCHNQDPVLFRCKQRVLNVEAVKVIKFYLRLGYGRHT